MKKNIKGFSLIEMLVVLVIFSVLAILATQTIFLSLRSSRKASNIVVVREELDYAMSIMERHLKGAKSWEDCTPAGFDEEVINYRDENGDSVSFTCYLAADDEYIASGSSAVRLTSDEIIITSCTFDCTNIAGEIPTLGIEIEGRDAGSADIEGATIVLSTQVYLRNY